MVESTLLSSLVLISVRLDSTEAVSAFVKLRFRSFFSFFFFCFHAFWSNAVTVYALFIE